MAEKDFIKENIVGRKEDWRKRTKHYARVMISALLFGSVSAAAFAGLEPKLREHFYPLETEAVVLETEELPSESDALAESGESEGGTSAVEGAASSGDASTASSEAETSVAETAAVEETTPVEDLVEQAMDAHVYRVEDVENLNLALRHVASEAEQSLVEVESRDTSTDMFGLEVASGHQAAGILIARTGDELLVLTSSDILQDGASISVKIGGVSYAAELKAKDEADGIAVVSIAQHTLSAKDRHELRTVTIGNAGRLQRGDLLLAVGAPDGSFPSCTTGILSSVTYNTSYIDGSIAAMQADLHAEAKSGTFVLNTKGELIGWVSSHLGDTVEGYQRIAVVTDFLAQIQKLSNGASYPYLGFHAQEVNDEMGRAGLPKGLYIKECEKNSPAYNAGIQSGDVLTRIEDTEITNMPEFRKVLGTLEAGDEIRVTVQRQRGVEYSEVEYKVTVGAR
ncbi:MAG TPA: hypothetical protein DD632_03360 [Oribacterium sp.]|nr:hypothetical protein [Oribacterium sp.]HCS66707.1 hypothetical protein [Oribacterium sp.]